MIDKRNTKTQHVTYKQVVRAYKSIRNNGKAAGVDDISLKDFDKEKDKQLYKIWNRMASGSYFPPAVREATIDKTDGGVRRLGIPTVGDRVAQMVVKHQVEMRFEKMFHEDSYGYRPKRNAHDALTKARKRCLEYDWGIDLDIKGFFDNIDHELLMRCVRPHVDEKWVLIYIERWLKAPLKDKSGELKTREKGTPQGGVISPLLANIFLHFVVDKWMEKYHPQNAFERYADDVIIHCRSEKEAKSLLNEVTTRVNKCKLELHPDKTKIFYCKDYRRTGNYRNVSFDFLSHTFKPRALKSINGNNLFLGFCPAISIKVRKEKIKKVKWLYQQFYVKSDLREIAELVNPVVRGWISYYGRVNFWKIKPIFNILNFRLAKWLKRSFKKFRYSLGKAFKYLKRYQKRHPELFIHWKYGFTV